MNLEHHLSDRLLMIILFMIAFLVQADHLVMIPLGSEIAASTGLPLTQSGLLVSIYPIAAAISAFVFAPFSDRLGRKKIITGLTFGFSISLLGCALADTSQEIYFYRILSGVFGGIIIPNALAYIGDRFEGTQKIKALSTLTLSFPIASVLGVPIGAWLSDLFSWRITFALFAAASLLCALFALYFPAIKGFKHHSIFHQYKELVALWYNKEIRLVFVIQFFMLIGLFGFVPNLSLFLTANFHMSTTEIGLCYMQGGVGAILGNLLARRLLQRDFKAGLISVGSFIMGLVLLLMTNEFLPPGFIGLGFALTMFGGSLRMPALQVVLSDMVKADLRGRLFSMSLIVSNITMGLGGLWSLPLLTLKDGELHGMAQIGIISFITLCFVPIFVHLLQRHEKTQQT